MDGRCRDLTASAKLLRDVDEPNRFVSFGPWEDIEHARRWRSLEGFQERIGRLQEVLDELRAPHAGAGRGDLRRRFASIAG